MTEKFVLGTTQPTRANVGEVLDPRARFAPPVHRDDAEPMGGRSVVDRHALQMALILHAADLVIQEEKAAERLLKELGTVRPREGRLAQMSRREHLNVADLTGRRHGRTYGPSRGGWIPVTWLDTNERQLVHEDGLLIRFTVQTVGFVPAAERDSKVAEESDAAWVAEEEVA